jgi:hypothetical protein
MDWWQGSLLTSENLNELGIASDAQFGVIATHDCDLSNPAEIEVEIVLGDECCKVEALYTKARHPRIIHLSYGAAASRINVALYQAKRAFIKKENLRLIKKQDNNLELIATEKQGFKQWLAARYGRPAFPNKFEHHLRKKINKKDSVEKVFGKICQKYSEYVVAVFFDLDEGRFSELIEEPYILKIIIAYESDLALDKRNVFIENIKIDIKNLFIEAFGDVETTQEIALEALDLLPDTHVSLALLRRIDQWRLEYISLSEE